MFNGVLCRYRVVHRIHVDEPEDIGTLGFAAEYRINDLVFDLLGIVGAGEVNQVGGVFGYRGIVAQFFQFGGMYSSRRTNST